MNTEARFPSIHASAAFTDSAVVHANHVGVNPIELDALSQVISRLSRTRARSHPVRWSESFVSWRNWGTSRSQPPRPGPWWSLRAPGQLLSAYFWSVWIPRHMFSCSLKVSLVPHLCCGTLRTHSTSPPCSALQAARTPRVSSCISWPTTIPEPELPELVAVQVGDAPARRPNHEGVPDLSVHRQVRWCRTNTIKKQRAPGATRWQPPALTNGCLARTTPTSPVCRHRQATTKARREPLGAVLWQSQGGSVRWLTSLPTDRSSTSRKAS